MKRVFAKAALHDLDDTAFYLQERNLQAAEAFIASLFEKIDLVSAQPSIGKKIDGFPGRDVRKIVHGDYVIVYEIVKDEFRIYRIFHTARDPEELLSDLFSDDES